LRSPGCTWTLAAEALATRDAGRASAFEPLPILEILLSSTAGKSGMAGSKT
jgi:hypothetical protein